MTITNIRVENERKTNLKLFSSYSCYIANTDRKYEFLNGLHRRKSSRKYAKKAEKSFFFFKP